jgi:hypothetical protein
MSGTFTTWQYQPPYGAEGGGNPTVLYGPGPFFRDMQDATRSAYNRAPGADYPDGYLGTIHTRRGDRVLTDLKRRQNQKSYQRGVHKGERIDQSDYFWPGDLNWKGIELEAQGRKFAPAGQGTTVLQNDGKVSRAALGVLSVDPKRSQQLTHLRPPWS